MWVVSVLNQQNKYFVYMTDASDYMDWAENVGLKILGVWYDETLMP